MELTSLLNSFESLEQFECLTAVINAYAENARGEKIESIGFNKRTEYVYLSLSNGVQIASRGFGVEYIVTDFNNGDEYFYTSYIEALNHEYIKPVK